MSSGVSAVSAASSRFNMVKDPTWVVVTSSAMVGVSSSAVTSASSWRRRTSSAASRFGEPNRSSAALGVSAVTSSASHCWVRMGSVGAAESDLRCGSASAGASAVNGAGATGPCSGAVISRASVSRRILEMTGPSGSWALVSKPVAMTVTQILSSRLASWPYPQMTSAVAPAWSWM